MLLRLTRVTRQGLPKFNRDNHFLFNRILLVVTGDKTIWRGITKIDGYWAWYKRTEEERSVLVETTAVNRLPVWKHDITWFFTKSYLKLTGKKDTICQGCGEGIQRWSITDPNKKENSKVRLKVCDICVNFYDFHLTKKLL